jgi:hypothetical protein
MSDIKQKLDSPIWVLYLFSSGKKGRLSCRLPDFSGLMDLPGRMVRLLVLLQLAYLEDADLPSEVRGFRQAPALADAYEENKFVDPPEPETITTYLCQLCKRLAKPFADGGAFPLLIERVPNTGARLLFPVEILHVGRARTTDGGVFPPAPPISQPDIPRPRLDVRSFAARLRQPDATDPAKPKRPLGNHF